MNMTKSMFESTRVVFGILFMFGLFQTLFAGEVDLTVAGRGYELIRTGPGIMRIRYRAELPGALNDLHAVGVVSQPDRSGEELISKTRHIGSYSTVEGCLEFDLPQLGYYDVAVKLFSNEKVIAEATTTCAVIPNNSEILVRDFGVCTHLRGVEGFFSRYLDLIRMAGISRIRDDFTWGIVEKEKGVYNVPDYYGEYLAAATNRGLEPLLILCYNTPNYKAGTRGFPKGDEARQAFVQYARMAVSSYGRYVKNWELYNEPVGVSIVTEYLPLLKLVYPAIHELQPEAEVISCGGAGAGGGVGGQYIWGIFRAGGVDYQDGFSIHAYMAPSNPDTGYPAKNNPLPAVNVPVVWKYMQNSVINRFTREDGKALNLWVTEMGWTCGGKKPVSDTLQASYLLRTYLLARRHGTAKAVFWYDFMNDGDTFENKEHNFGLVRRDFSPKPSYVAVAILSNTLANRKFAGILMDGAVKLYQYGEKKDRIIAGWSVNGDKEVTVNLPAGSFVLRDWQGRETPLVPMLGNVTLTLTEMPVYIVSKQQR
jgi:hypothetical protein